ncbi:MAG: sigma-70 family RNA polymerase sigma factor [Gemmataceae bacterium]|nr:sigma-70 family RNA polymerase sigma factor [Gemmataceae bacterium]
MSDNPTDTVFWLPAAHAGDAEALGRLLEACRGYLLLLARRELNPDLLAKGSASDLVQETFLEAQRDFARFQGSTQAELLAWLRRLLLNNLLNFTDRYRGTNKRQIGREVALAVSDSSADRGGGLAANLPSPSSAVATQEQTAAIGRALERLPDHYRQVVLLRYQEECSFGEIGQVLGLTANAARKLLLRAIERLRAELGGLA